MSLVNKIKDIILENNYFDTLAGQKFVEWNDIKKRPLLRLDGCSRT